MPLYVIERAFAEQLDLTSDDVKLIEEVNADEGVRLVDLDLADFLATLAGAPERHPRVVGVEAAVATAAIAEVVVEDPRARVRQDPVGLRELGEALLRARLRRDVRVQRAGEPAEGAPEL